LMASVGKVNNQLLSRLNQIDYYNFPIPKALAKEYVDSVFLPILNSCQIHNNDLLCTFIEHISMQIINTFSKFKISNSFLSGGGVFNNYLISRLSLLTKTELIIPSTEMIKFKESIIFGFLGVLRILNKDNCLASATGAIKNHSSGDIYLV